MSWQQYVDANLVGTGLVSKAAIHGLDGTKWASSAGFNVAPAEVQFIVQNIKAPQAEGFYANGIKLAGQKYTFLQYEQNKKAYGRKGADGGVCVVKTNQALLIGVYEGGIQAGQCNSVVEKLGDYLTENNY